MIKLRFTHVIPIGLVILSSIINFCCKCNVVFFNACAFSGCCRNVLDIRDYKTCRSLSIEINVYWTWFAKILFELFKFVNYINCNLKAE